MTEGRGESDQEPVGEALSRMTADEFRDTLINLFGKHGWRTLFARGAGYSRTQVYRYSRTPRFVPLKVAVIVEMLCILKAFKLPFPVSFNPDMVKGIDEGVPPLAEVQSGSSAIDPKLTGQEVVSAIFGHERDGPRAVQPPGQAMLFVWRRGQSVEDVAAALKRKLEGLDDDEESAE